MSVFFLNSALLTQLSPNNSANRNLPKIVHGFSTSLVAAPDKPCTISSNLSIIEANFGKNIPVKLLKQKHSNIFHLVKHHDEVTAHIEADALITTEPNILLGVRTADCLPILIACPTRGVVAAIHAGWRGLYSGIVERCIAFLYEEMGAQQDELMAALGPCIMPSSYEVDADFYKNFVNKNAINANFFHIKPEYHVDSPHSTEKSSNLSPNTKYYFDLQGYAKSTLLTLGLAPSKIESLSIDTFSNPQLLQSYRRDCQINNSLQAKNQHISEEKGKILTSHQLANNNNKTAALVRSTNQGCQVSVIGLIT